MYASPLGPIFLELLGAFLLSFQCLLNVCSLFFHGIKITEQYLLCICILKAIWRPKITSAGRHQTWERLSTKDINLQWHLRKLSPYFIDPFKILQCISRVIYCLELSLQHHISPSFHVFLLRNGPCRKLNSLNTPPPAFMVVGAPANDITITAGISSSVWWIGRDMARGEILGNWLGCFGPLFTKIFHYHRQSAITLMVDLRGCCHELQVALNASSHLSTNTWS